MVVATHRDTKLLVDLGAIQTNIRNEQSVLESGIEIFAVVKANGYGHGIVDVAKAAQAAGATGFCVAMVDEGLALRDAGIELPILVLGITPIEYAPLAAERTISLTVGDVEWLKAYLTSAKVDKPLNVHLGIDTGMGRIGFRDTDHLSQAVALLDNSQFNFEGVFTHFATADEVDSTYFNQQIDKWNQLTAVISTWPRYVHVANSATGLWHLPVKGNLIRLGISMYGLNPSGTAIPTVPYELVAAAQLVTQVVFQKQLHAGDSVSYGATYTAQRDEWVATLPVGYADGYPRRMQGFHVLVDGEFCEIIGRVCMDQMMVRLNHPVEIGTSVVLIGHQEQLEISATDVAEYAGTINYEILTGISERVQRVY